MAGRAVALLALILLGLVAVGYQLTPHEHVASGCFWWTASDVGQVVPGRNGCVRGYARAGGALAESRDQASYQLSYFPPPQGSCSFRPGDAVVLGYHAIFDDGRTIIEIDRCA